jgi:predicted AAA+ superfamily ATPase
MTPEALREKLEANPEQNRVIIDEVQRVPDILNIVHDLIEEKRSIQFILTGSSSRKLRRGGVNLLGGRALWKNFHPFIAHELKDQFDLQKALTTGMIPLIWGSSDPQETLRAYVDLYLREEVKAEALVRQIGDFSRFLETISFSHGSILNLANVSRECQVPRKTLDLHLQILCDLLLGYLIPVFEKRAQRELTSHPKFYYFDPGVFRVLRKQGFLDQSNETDGAALEGLVAEHLRSWIDFQKEKNDLYFWRTRSGVEVDFIIYGSTTFAAFEVKNGQTIAPHDLRGLKEFKKDFPEASLTLIYRGREMLKRDGVLCIPAEQFLTNLNPLSQKLL